MEDLKAGERQMYELDNRKDQVMTIVKLALANVTMWVRDRYFPPKYARATWSRLAPFFWLPGRVVTETDTVTFEPRAFNDRRLSRDLAAMRDILDEVRPQLPGAHRLHFVVPASAGVRGQARRRSEA
ncbi:MAG: hypothetical protein M3Q29_13865 [Chloroflexota bacterium]|nr:hypothetical protein [Chloroflexota bacterium]